MARRSNDHAISSEDFAKLWGRGGVSAKATDCTCGMWQCKSPGHVEHGVECPLAETGLYPSSIADWLEE